MDGLQADQRCEAILDPRSGLRIRFDERAIELRRDGLLVVGLQDPRLGPHDLAQRPEADPVSVGKAPAFSPCDEIRQLIDAATELADQTRLAEPRFGNDRDELRCRTRARSFEELREHRELEIPPDERCTVTLLCAEVSIRMEREPSGNRL